MSTSSGARDALWSKAQELEWADKVLAKSKLTKKEADAIAHKIKRKIAKEHGLL